MRRITKQANALGLTDGSELGFFIKVTDAVVASRTL
jgi:hypothetical protein